MSIPPIVSQKPNEFAPYAVPAAYPVASTVAGLMIGPYDIEQATLATLAGWLPGYFSTVEQDRGIPAGTLKRPPGPESYRGSTDDTAFVQDETPTIIVMAQPLGEPERYASAGYVQPYSVTVMCVVIQESEDETRQLASYYGTAVMAAIAQNGALGGIAEDTILSGSPNIEFVAPDNRQLMTARVEFTVYPAPVVQDTAGVGTLGAPNPVQPPWPPWQTVTDEDVTVTPVPVTSTLPPGT